VGGGEDDEETEVLLDAVEAVVDVLGDEDGVAAGGGVVDAVDGDPSLAGQDDVDLVFVVGGSGCPRTRRPERRCRR
jgi:hypothetical protein